jgi:signal transduction histidine kinase
VEPIYVPRLVASTLDGLRAAASVVGVELRTAQLPGVTIEGDEDRLVQVLTNLVSNAIKFSPRHGVVDVGVEAAAAGRLRFFVSDQGAGIAECQRGRLFTKFQQLDSSDTRCKNGTGLGLAISKAIVEQHRGEIGVQSRVGRGSTFWFELPGVAASS